MIFQIGEMVLQDLSMLMKVIGELLFIIMVEQNQVLVVKPQEMI